MQNARRLAYRRALYCEGSHNLEKKLKFGSLKVGGRVGRSGGSWECWGVLVGMVPSTAARPGGYPRRGHALRDEQALTFRHWSDPPAGWRKLCGWVMQLCSMRFFSLQSFCYSQLLESGWGGALESACRTVSLGLRSPDQIQCYGCRKRGCCWEMDALPSPSFFKAIWYVGLFYSLGFLLKASVSAGGG